MNSVEDKLVIPVSPISAPISSRADDRGSGPEPTSPSRRSFRDSFMYNFDSVRVRLRKSDSTVVYLMSLCRLRISQEKAAADSAEKLISRSDLSQILLAGESSAGLCVDAFRLNVIKRARQSRQFIDEMEEEVLKPLERSRKSHEKLYSSLEKDGRLMADALKDEYRMHDDALMAYDKAYRLAASGLRLLGPTTLTEDHIRIGLNCESAIASERRYHEAVLRVNQVRREYSESMALILTQLEDLERSRLALIKEATDKIFVFEFSLNRSAQYELESSFKEIESASSTDELAAYLATQPETNDSGPVMAVSAKDFADLPAPVLGTSAPTEMQSAEHHVIDAVWGAPRALNIDELEALKEVFATETGRLSFCRALGEQEPELKSAEAFSNLGNILKSALTAAEAAMDSETGRRVAAFALRFFVFSAEDNRKKFIQSEIYHHSLWNRIHFWEESLALTVADSFINEYADNTGDSDPVPAVVDSGLTIDRFGTYLMVFGISVQSAIEIVKRVIRRDFPNISYAESIQERLLRSIKVAHDRQERNMALIQQSRPSSPTSPS